MKRILGILMALLLIVGSTTLLAIADKAVPEAELVLSGAELPAEVAADDTAAEAVEVDAVAVDGTLTADAADISGDFKDPAFLAKVYDLTGKTPGSPIYASDVDKIQDMNLSRLGIASLDGIEHFVALRIFYCNYNELTSLDLSGNPELVNVFCTNNKLASANMTGLNKLQTLDLSYNLMTTFDASNLPALVELYLTHNDLTSLDITNTPNLKKLNLERNEFASKAGILGYTEAELAALDVFAFDPQGKDPTTPPNPNPNPGPGDDPPVLGKLEKLEKIDPLKEWIEMTYAESGLNIKVTGAWWILMLLFLPLVLLSPVRWGKMFF